jgi:hypothetical protein
MLLAAEEFCDLFPAVYLHFCKRPRPQDRRLTLQMTAVLSQLSLSGPLTVGEMAWKRYAGPPAAAHASGR